MTLVCCCCPGIPRCRQCELGAPRRHNGHIISIMRLHNSQYWHQPVVLLLLCPSHRDTYYLPRAPVWEGLLSKPESASCGLRSPGAWTSSQAHLGKHSTVLFGCGLSPDVAPPDCKLFFFSPAISSSLIFVLRGFSGLAAFFHPQYHI